MKLVLTLRGEFHRLPATNKLEVELTDWLKSVQGLAGKLRQRSLEKLRQSFGLDFIPKEILIEFLQKIDPKTVYQIPELQLLKIVPFTKGEIIFYQYKFVSHSVEIDLRSDDPQIPSYWAINSVSQPGTYYFKWDMKNNYCPDWLIPIAAEVQQYWREMSELEKINSVLYSNSTDEVYFQLPSDPKVNFTVTLDELDSKTTQAIDYLKKKQEITSYLGNSLIEEYTNKYLSVSAKSFPPNLAINTSIEPKQKIVIGRGNSRQILNQIINNAENFLLISSYIIEDETITRLICEKSVCLPQGVWIITNLLDEVIDQIDIDNIDEIDLTQKYRYTTEKKSYCLQMLLSAGANIRIGDFHLKSYISERAAYLGSCNLTGKSLDFNLEGGVVFQNTKTHKGLLDMFNYLWQYYGHYDILPIVGKKGFLQRSVPKMQIPNSFYHPYLLTYYQYKDDLLRQIQAVKGEIKVYSYSFNPGSEFLALLRTKSTCIYLNSVPDNTRLVTKTIKNQHAKITILSDEVAYIGGINFDFRTTKRNLVDLMYRTTDPEEISQIFRQLATVYV